MKNLRIVSVLAVTVLTFLLSSHTHRNAEEGMYPLSQLGSVNLKEAGLKIPVSEIYDPGGVSMTNALVRLGGCTGSFISSNGLIITNHHCVFSAVAGHSTPENNHLDNGFYAADQDAELKTDIPCRITQSFEDVSAAVLDGIKPDMKAADKKALISKNIETLQSAERKKYPELEIDISEMHVGKYYTLFRYKLLKDVRLVYVPPQAIGKFGGESDNWVWPRHNGDFSIVRVYEDGKPYKPERFIPVNPKGTSEGDFVFIMGYPGTTYRHAPAEYLTYQNDYVLPLIAEWYDAQIEILEKDAGANKELQLRYAGRLASLSNVTKNFKGKMQGFRRTNILEERLAEQDVLRSVAPASKRYIFDDLKRFHKEKFALATDVLMGNQMARASGLFYAASFTDRYRNKLKSMSGSEGKKWVSDNAEKLIKEFKSGYRQVNAEVDLKNMSYCAFMLIERKTELGLALQEYLKPVRVSPGSLEASLRKMWLKSKYSKVQETLDRAESDMYKFILKKDVLSNLAALVNGIMDPKNTRWNELNTEIDALLPELATIKESNSNRSYIPDANATLRLTYGYIKGFEPEDGVYNAPFTTIKGILEKAEPEGDYYMPSYLLEKYRTVEAADVLKHPKVQEVVVGMLYNMDTTGGNSGSPILDAYGNLVGVNFDRAYTATINDFAWNESYSRSIGVDIRYVIYVMKYMHAADGLLKEMGVTGI
ncbi:MAG: S46 family peptidase [Flavobacteriales bacterium]|nr:S46 family peptidase [Flavobacteriales bacterium]